MRIAETDRTIIEVLSTSDAPFMLELVNSPPWQQFIGPNQVADVAMAAEFIENRFLNAYVDLGYTYYTARIASNWHPIGICGFLKKPYLDYEDFGFAYLPKYHRRGFGYEVGMAVLKHGIAAFGFNVLDAVTAPSNAAARALLEKLGFTREGAVDCGKSVGLQCHYRMRNHVIKELLDQS